MSRDYDARVGGRGQYAKGVERRQEILDTALRVMAAKGYRNTSLRGIGRELGIEPGHILHYFPSREKLLEAVVEMWDRRNVEALRAESKPGPDGGLLPLFPVVARRNMAVPGLVHLYTAFAAEAAAENHPSREFFRRRFEGGRSLLEDELRRGQIAGVYQPDLDPRSTATRLIAYSDGLQLQWLLDPTIDLPGELQRTIDAIKVKGSTTKQ